jgi:Flp pilus assembly protein TadG
VEVVIIVPVLVMLLGVIGIGGRYWYAQTTVEQTAASAARAATLLRSGTEAERTARRIVQEDLQRAGACDVHDVDVDTSAFLAPVGSRGEVRVMVTCSLSSAGLEVPGWPGTITVSHTATSVLDTYRGRNG